MKLYQDNHITLDKPSGSTTIIINNRSTTSSGQSSSSSTSLDNTVATMPADISVGAHQQPVQPRIKYPSSSAGTKRKAFNSDWFSKYRWLEYSQERDSAYCYACRIFAISAKKSDAFTHTGFRDWKHATGQNGSLAKHDSSHTHRQAMLSWAEYVKNADRNTLIGDRLDSTRCQQIQENRHYLKSIAEVILLCARQDLALRGHRESMESSNRGNFLEILELVTGHDEVVKDKLKNGPRNAIYTSPNIQNSLVNILGDMVTNVICSGVREAEIFSLLADETKDCSKREQISIVLRYVDNAAVSHEHFLTYVEAAGLTADKLTEYITNVLKQFRLDPQCMVSQGYDGASVMSGQCSGVQKRIREIAPHAIYIHCYAHTLNLVLVDSVKMVPYATEFFALLEHLYVFISTTKAHAIFMQKQSAMHSDKQPLQLQKLSDTRWACIDMLQLMLCVVCMTAYWPH